MKFYLFITSLLFQPFLLAQNTSITFNKTFTNDTINLLAQVVRPVEDGYLVWGGYTSTNITNARYLMKFDQVGNFVWSRNIVAGSQWNVIEDGKFVTETTDHNFVLALGGIVNNAAKEIHLIKMNNEGAELWHRSYNSDSTKIIRNIIQTSDDGFALAGHRYYEGGASDTARCLLIKTDTAGYVQWQKTYSMGNDARAFSVQQTPWDGGYILGAWGYSPTTGYDMFVVKTNSIGDSLWSRRYGGIYYDWGAQIVPLTTLQEYQAGQPIQYSLTGAWRDTNSAWEAKLYIAKLNSTGGIIWQQKHANYSYFYNLQTFPIIRQGKRIIGVAGFENSQGFQNPIIVSFSATGDIEWSKPITLDPTKSSYIKDMRPTEDGGYVLAGYQYSTPQTAWVLKIDSLGNTCSFVGCDSTIYTGLEAEILLPNPTFSLIPNPSSGTVILVFAEAINTSSLLTISDISGRLVHRVALKTGTRELTIELQNIRAGIYFCHLSGNAKTEKLVIIR